MTDASATQPTPAYFVAGGTGISAETLGNMILGQFPTVTFTTHKIPFIKTVEQAEGVVRMIDAAAAKGVHPLIFSTVAETVVSDVLQRANGAFIDLFGNALETVEQIVHVGAAHNVGSVHGIADRSQYEARMKAVEFSMEHDDGQSLRAFDEADVILIAPSRCGKTPTSMYLALQHGLKTANYPLVEEDFESAALPRPLKPYADRCFGLLSTAARLSQVRSERRPNSRYSSLAQCSFELRRAEAMYRAHRITSVNSANMSVEEIATVVLQSLEQRRKR